MTALMQHAGAGIIIITVPVYQSRITHHATGNIIEYNAEMMPSAFYSRTISSERLCYATVEDIGNLLF